MQSKISLMTLSLVALLAAWAFVSTPLANAQPCQLGLNVTYTPVQQLSLSDIDFEHFESRNLLFTVVITNPNVAATARLRGTLHVALSDGSYRGDALNFVTAEFPVPSGGRQITNMDLGYKAEIRIDDLQFESAAKENVQDVALSTGKFPAGVYTLNIVLAQTNCSVTGDSAVGTKDIEFDLTNPSRVELRSPRDGEQTGEFPLFEYYSDGNPVTLTVAEIGAGQSRDEAIDRQPSMLTTELNGQNSFLYAGGRPLERGKSYVWRVTTSASGSGGAANEVTSPIGLFTVAQTPGAEEGTTEDAILRQLEEVFGGRYPALFKSIRDGQLTLSGTFTLNQSSLTEAQLLDLINQLREMSDSVDLTLE
jgi:hypothetical protein